MRRNPLPVTVVFASFTGEEAGLLGSREFVRLAGRTEVERRRRAEQRHDRLGRRKQPDGQHHPLLQRRASATSSTARRSCSRDLILYDAKYYRGTDAAAFYEGWGDIVGGIGSYPVLANPNYHQPTDFLETMNHQQIMETAKVDGGDARLSGVEPVAAEGSASAAQDGAGVEVIVDAEPRGRHQELRRRVRPGVGVRCATA